MSTHQASEQMLGYLYQVRYALSLLLNNDNENHQISIERFDDVAFSQDDTPKQMIQLKHHVRQHGCPKIIVLSPMIGSLKIKPSNF